MRAAKRAWVGFSDSQGIKDSSAIYLTFTNGGQSPALNVFISVDSDVHAITASSSSCTDDCVLNGAEMLPNVPFKFRVPRTDQPDPGPNLPFWIVARIDYKDVDGGSHKTLICFERRENRPSTELVACPEKDSNYAD
jgi:hypothetical protein